MLYQKTATNVLTSTNFIARFRFFPRQTLAQHKTYVHSMLYMCNHKALSSDLQQQQKGKHLQISMRCCQTEQKQIKP